MMTIKDLRDILVHFEDRKYDNYEVILWDYNHQEKLGWGGGYSLSHPDNKLCFPVTVTPIDGVTIDERLKKLVGTLNEKNKRVRKKREKKTVNR